MARKPNRESSLEQIEAEFVEAVVRETGMVPSLATQIVGPIIRHLVHTYPGEKIYIPSPRREYPVDEIRAAYEATGDRDAVCARFGISKTTLYELLKIDSKAA